MTMTDDGMHIEHREVHWLNAKLSIRDSLDPVSKITREK
jgi:hypothetical protein